MEKENTDAAMPGLPRDEAQAGADPRGALPGGGRSAWTSAGKAPGRGAYVCPDSQCLKKA